MPAAARDLSSLLSQIDPEASLARRHLWLIGLFDWIRGDGKAPEAAAGRVELLLDALESRPELGPRVRRWWDRFTREVDLTALLADHGFAPRTAFVSELALRLRRKLLPGTPETADANELFRLVLPGEFDARWIALLPERQLARIGTLLREPEPAAGTGEAPRWRHMLVDAVLYCTSQVAAAGFSPELRLRMSEAARQARPFHALMNDLERLHHELLRSPVDEAALQAAFTAFRERLEACRAASATVYEHFEDNGISVGLVFRLRQLRERILRIRELLDGLIAPQPGPSVARLITRLIAAGGERHSVRALIASNSSLLAAKVAERSAETGEHYITRDRAAYGRMLRQAAGGGAMTSLTVLMKFALLALGLSAFWGGLAAGLMYAGSFIAIQLLHLTLATKQPAMTAPAMAAKLRDLHDDAAIEDFVSEVTHLVRSQVAAVLGNVLVVVPAVLALAGLLHLTLGRAMVEPAYAHKVLHSLSLAGPTALFAAFTGVLLFSASIVAGWVENAFVLHRLDSALRYNPRIVRLLGEARADRWATFMRQNISGLSSNTALGLMLGLAPPVAAFFGLGLDVRHVTLSAGQIAAAAAALGPAILQSPALWWALAAIPVIGAINVSVSFYFAFRLALRAHNVGQVQRSRIHAAIWARWRHRPLSFFIPSRGI
ncbi:recombinase [Xenophilus arseniciresistens]|uniref:Recombinase n=1 Tax=Xenophilus arseniciresistens TaxID=1283306 RepID=A0AAE3T113_9BURK|nr:recombinase [Xenophilus arseniciresistens]MDA7418729.1 recombinase [Xenophilus arseniciresistens]